MYELVNKQFIEVKEYKEQRVVTFKDIDTLHQRPTGTASRNFRANRKHFIEGVDFFSVELTNDEIRRQFGAGRNAGKNLILLTLSGYLMIVKSFTDELAWEVQRQLVNTYFRANQQNNHSGIDQLAIITTIKELCEKNCELNDKINNLNKENHELKEQIERLNRELIKSNHEFTAIIKILCEKMCGLYEKKQSRKYKLK